MDALFSQIYFWNKTLHISESSSVHHQDFSLLYTQQYYGWILILLANCQWNLYDITIVVCTVKKKTADDGQRNCPKHVEFYSKNKFEKLARLVCFTIKLYHDARSPERKIRFLNLLAPELLFFLNFSTLCI